MSALISLLTQRRTQAYGPMASDSKISAESLGRIIRKVAAGEVDQLHKKFKIPQNFFPRDSRPNIAGASSDVSNMMALKTKNQRKIAWLDFRLVYAGFSGSGWDNISFYEFVKAWKVVRKYYATRPVTRTHSYSISIDKLRTAIYFFKFAMGTYGSVMMCLWGKARHIRHFNPLSNEKKVVAQMLNIRPEGVLRWEFGSTEVYKPKYFICHDEMTNSLILSVRGTMNIADVFTDLSCGYVNWQGGRVHRGMLECTRRLLREFAHELPGWLAKYRPSALYCVGHSLGGSVAFLVAVELLARIDEFRKFTENPDFFVHCYAFGAPPTLTEGIAQKFKGVSDTFINQSDYCSGVSFWNLFFLKSMITRCSREMNHAHKNMSPAEREAVVFAALDDERATTLHDGLASLKFHIPGTIYHIQTQMARKYGEAANPRPADLTVVGAAAFFTPSRSRSSSSSAQSVSIQTQSPVDAVGSTKAATEAGSRMSGASAYNGRRKQSNKLVKETVLEISSGEEFDDRAFITSSLLNHLPDQYEKNLNLVLAWLERSRLAD